MHSLAVRLLSFLLVISHFTTACTYLYVVIHVWQMSLALYSSTGDMQFIHAHTRDKLTSRIDLLADKLRSQYSRCVPALCFLA